jgi:hypothetical protein
MRSVLLLLLLICFVEGSFAQSAAINTDGSNADASAILDVKSTNKGMLVPRMTTAQRTAIASPAKGLLVFDNDTGDFWFYNGTAWTSLTSGESTNVWKKNADTVYNTNKGSVGIGINNSLQAKLHILDTTAVRTNFLLLSGAPDVPGLSLFTNSRVGERTPAIGFNAKISKDDFIARRIGNGHASYFEYWPSQNLLTYRISRTTGAINTPLDEITSFSINRDGNFRILGTQSAASPVLDVWGRMRSYELNTDRIGIGIDPSTTYAFDVDGGPSRFRTDTRIDGVLNPNNALTIGNNTTIQGNLSVENATVQGSLVVEGNKGNVRSHNGTQVKIVRTSIILSATNLSAGGFVDSGIYGFETFGATPQVYVGNLISATTGDWAKIEFIPFEVTATGCKFRVFNHGSSAATVQATYSLMIIGPQ